MQFFINDMPIKLTDNLKMVRMYVESIGCHLFVFSYKQFEVKVVLQNWRIETHRIIEFTDGCSKFGNDQFVPLQKLEDLENMCNILERTFVKF